MESSSSHHHKNKTELNFLTKKHVFQKAIKFFLPVLFLFVAITVIVLSLYNKIEIETLRIQEERTISLQHDHISMDIAMVSSDLLILADNYLLSNLWNDDGTIDSLTCSAITQDFFSLAEHSNLYDQVRLLDETGMELIRINYNQGNPYVVPHENLQNKAERYYFYDSFRLQEEEVFVSPLDLNIEHGEIELPIKPMIRFATPVFNQQGEKCGIVLLNYLASHIIEHLIEHSSEDYGSQPLLLNNDGYFLVGPNPEENWGFMYQDRVHHTFAYSFPEEWEKIISEEDFQFHTSNGMFTYRIIYPLAAGQISSSGSGEAYTPSVSDIDANAYCWYMISHIPSNTLYAERTRRFWIALSILVLLAVILFIGSWKLARAAIIRSNTEKLKLKTSKLEAVATLAGGVAHKFNNLMVGIIGYADLLKMQNITDPVITEQLNAITDSAKKAGNLSHQLLAFAGGGKYLPEELDLNSIILNSVNQIKQLFTDSADIKTHLKPNIAKIVADPEQIKQVINAVLTNSLEATAKHHGFIKVFTENIDITNDFAESHPPLKQGLFVSLIIEDNGSGMDEPTLCKIFDPFFSTKFTGRGLSMAAVHGIIESHKGLIEITSQENIGTTVKIFFPTA